MSEADRALLAFVNRALNWGERRIAVLAGLVAAASDRALDGARCLVKLNGAEIVDVRG